MGFACLVPEAAGLTLAATLLLFLGTVVAVFWVFCSRWRPAGWMGFACLVPEAAGLTLAAILLLGLGTAVAVFWVACSRWRLQQHRTGRTTNVHLSVFAKVPSMLLV